MMALLKNGIWYKKTNSFDRFIWSLLQKAFQMEKKKTKKKQKKKTKKLKPVKILKSLTI